MPITSEELEQLKSKSKISLLLVKPNKDEIKAVNTAISKGHPLTRLSISGLSADLVTYVSDIIDKTTHLQQLEITDSTAITDKEIKPIVDPFKKIMTNQLKTNEKLVFSISFKNNGLSNEGARYIQRELLTEMNFKKNQIVKSFDLSGNNIGAEIIQSINNILSLQHKSRKEEFANDPRTSELFSQRSSVSNLSESSADFNTEVSSPYSKSEMSTSELNSNAVTQKDNDVEKTLDNLKNTQVRQIDASFAKDHSNKPFILNINLSPENRSLQYIGNNELPSEHVMQLQSMLNSSANTNKLPVVANNLQSGGSSIMPGNTNDSLSGLPSQQDTQSNSATKSSLQVNPPLYKMLSPEDIELQKLLKIKPTQSETTIEFNQVFTLPINRFYSALFKNSNNSSISEITQNDDEATKVEVIDTRPIRWYSQYQYLLDEIEEANYDLRLARNKLTEAKNALLQSDNNNTDVNAQEENLIKRRNQVKVFTNRIEKLERNKQLILRELKADGYTITPKSDYQRGENFSYSFEIKKYYRDSSNYVQETFDKNLFLGNTTEGQQNWLKYKQQLDAKLILGTSPALESSQLRRQFMIEGNQLMSADSFNKLKIALKEITDAVTKQKNQKAELQARLPANEELVNTTNTELEAVKQQIQEKETSIQEMNKKQNSDKENINTQVVQLTNQIEQELKPKQQSLENVLAQCAELPNKIKACDEKIKELFKDYTNTNNTALNEERWNYLKRWNDPNLNGAGPLKDMLISPNVDPLTNFIESLSEQQNTKAVMLDVYYFNLTTDGFYNQYGESLVDFMKTSHGPQVVAVLPYFDTNGMVSQEMFQVVHNPKPSLAKSPLPIVKFVETHALKVGWQGYAIGELRHSFNLFPGERKKVVIEKKTKLTSTITSSSSSQTETKRNITSSFEDNLQNELSTAANVTNSEEQKQKADTSQTQAAKTSSEYGSESTSERASSSSKSWHAEAEAEASYGGIGGGVSAKVSGGMAGESSKSSKNTSANSSNNNRSKEDALSLSLSDEGQKASKQSHDIASKNVQNRVSKVAAETSSNNKVEVTSTSSEQNETSTDNKETMEVENQNVGSTVNYNFFQIQNVYGTHVRLKDVKIFINTGKELIANTGINDIRVFELEEFNQIFSSLDSSDFSAVLSAMIVRKVLQQYSDLVPDSYTKLETLKIKQLDPIYGIEYEKQKPIIVSAYKTLSFSSQADTLTSAVTQQKPNDNNASNTTSNNSFDSIKTALDTLKEIIFEFNENTVINESTFTVNAPAYHLDAQLGIMPATEHYLEERRALEIEKQRLELEQKRAEIRHLDAKTRAGYFGTAVPVTSYGRFLSQPVNPPLNQPSVNVVSDSQAENDNNDVVSSNAPQLSNRKT